MTVVVSAGVRDTADHTTTAAALSALAPIGLDELDGVAALQTRVDRKYLMPVGVASALLDRLGPSARVLQIEGRREARYCSVYFDTSTLQCYRGAAHRRRRRFKVRTRRYLDTPGCFLEVKTRAGRGTTVKSRVARPSWAVEDLGGDGRRYVAGVLDAAGIDPAAAEGLAPVLRTDYRRATLYLPEGHARLTVDSDLTWCQLRDAAGETVGLHGLVVVETKSPGAPCHADHVLWALGVRPTHLSKYATGMALVRSELPANRWHRVLQQQIRPASTPTPPHHGAVEQGGPS